MFRLISFFAGYRGMIVAVLLAFGGLPAEADTLYPAKHTTSGANSGPLAGAPEAEQESTDLDIEPMAIDNAERNGSSDIEGTTIVSEVPPTFDSKAVETDASEAPILLRRWIYPLP